MNKLLLHLSILCLSLNLLTCETKSAEFMTPVILEEEVVLLTDENEPSNPSDESDDWEALTATEDDTYHLGVVDINRINYLFEDKLTKKFSEKSAFEDVHFWGAYNGDWSMMFKEKGSVQNHYEFNALSLGSDWRLKNDNGDFRAMINFQPMSGRTFIRNTISDVYAGTNKIPHHRIQIGHFRPATGMEGKRSAYLYPFLSRSQIAKNFGTVRKVGGKVMGDYSLVEYDLGVYSSDTYFKSFFPGAEFSGWMNIKPLGKTDGKYGDLKLGGGLERGHHRNGYCVTGTYAGYEYKKLSLDFEWANADGYNGLYGHSNKHARGMYTTLGYRITPKLQTLLRYDEFNPDKTVIKNSKHQYWAGINYFVKGPALRFMLNYVFCQNDSQKDSHKIMLGAQILL